MWTSSTVRLYRFKYILSWFSDRWRWQSLKLKQARELTHNSQIGSLPIPHSHTHQIPCHQSLLRRYFGTCWYIKPILFNLIRHGYPCVYVRFAKAHPSPWPMGYTASIDRVCAFMYETYSSVCATCATDGLWRHSASTGWFWNRMMRARTY